MPISPRPAAVLDPRDHGSRFVWRVSSRVQTNSAASLNGPLLTFRYTADKVLMIRTSTLTMLGVSAAIRGG